MIVKARVISSNESHAKVETIPEGECVGCKGCGHADVKVLSVLCDKKYVEGSLVEIEINYSSVLKAAAYAYIIPLIFFIIGLFLGIYLYSELLGLIMGLILMLITLFFVRKGEKNRISSGDFQAKIVKYSKEELCQI